MGTLCQSWAWKPDGLGIRITIFAFDYQKIPY